MRNLIVGTDWLTDCDDAVAVRIFAREHKKHTVRVMGIAVNACMEYSVTSLEGFLNTEGVRDIPIGIDTGATDYPGPALYQKRLAGYSERYRSNADAENAVRMYRRILAESPEPVEIAEIGFLQVIADLLESPPDDISVKSGAELVREKVPCIWVMAGKWDEDAGKEHNFCRNERSRRGAERFCRLCPVPVVFAGWEVGARVTSGDGLSHGDVLYRVLCDFGAPDGRESWDPMLALLAVTGDTAAAGYGTVRGEASVDAVTGENHFRQDKDGKHAYVVMLKEPEYYREQINSMIN